RFPPGLQGEVEEALDSIGRAAGHRFGDKDDPLLVSARSGAKFSMPGMMDTVLNLGLNDEAVEALAERSRDARFAYDSYRRFIQMYASVVLGVEHQVFEETLEFYKERRGVTLDTELEAEDWKKLAAEFKAIVEKTLSAPFPQEPAEQLWGAVAAVLSSWMNPRAINYRRLHNIPENLGTAVTIQAMVFGNMGQTSATGVAFTRNPSTGSRELYGEFLLNAQGEDVVAGLRTPQYLTESARIAAAAEEQSMEAAMPEIFAQFLATAALLERHYRDMQDMEFTVEQGKLWMLQTRRGKRTSKAAVRIAVDLTNEGMISKDEAVARVEPLSLEQLLHPALDPRAHRQIIATGLPASPGAASGEIVFSASEAEQWKAAGHKVILVRIETSPEDIMGMHAAEGILTARGGMTSHAAVVARGMGKPCVTGAGALRVNYAAETMSAGSLTFKKGDVLTIDGSTGQILKGAAEMRQPELSGEFAVLMGWADEARRLRVRANADTPRDARAARKFQAEGIGLCRTEHMFFEGERIIAMREMILAEDARGRAAALAKLLPMQRADFAELFEIMAGLPVTIRLLDPPLHEFLPQGEAEIAAVAKSLGIPAEKIAQRAAELEETNPMLGFRGCRITIAYPEIAEMQARAILEGAIRAKRKTGNPVHPEIMVPLIISKAEFDFTKARIDATAKAVEAEAREPVPYSVGTMIETPRACLRAGEIAEAAEFFSFGSNDLTQTCLALSRDDAGRFLPGYAAKGLLPADPFAVIDREGAGELIKIAVERGRARRKDMKIGVCGEHAGDPASIAFFEEAGLTYISCSPFRVPVARLAAAQAALMHQRQVESP
ncbi:MAG: pyruvate, phosphate dikinase, partial [Methylocapsa sp.]|nr:pyruvate, phosphate dikinase [Methylocapsa sp.]